MPAVADVAAVLDRGRRFIDEGALDLVGEIGEIAEPRE